MRPGLLSFDPAQRGPLGLLPLGPLRLLLRSLLKWQPSSALANEETWNFDWSPDGLIRSVRVNRLVHDAKPPTDAPSTPPEEPNVPGGADAPWNRAGGGHGFF